MCLGLYDNLLQLEEIMQSLEKYDFARKHIIFRNAREKEINEWKDKQIQIRKDCPEIAEIAKALKGGCREISI